jgi:hypothetical protein
MIAAALATLARAREWLTLLALGAAAAWIYVQWAEADQARDRYARWVEVTCAGAGAPYAGGAEQRTDTSSKPVTVTFDDGQRCRTAINLAVAFKGETDRATAERLARAMLEHDGKLLADARLARVAAEAAKAATERMEIANAEVEAQPDGTGRVGRDWFAALNDVAGLRTPSR